MSVLKAILKTSLALAMLLPLQAGIPALADSATETADKAVLTSQLSQYTQAFLQQDAAALARLWTEDGTYTDMDGRTYRGRVSIEQAFRGMFAGQKPSPITITVKDMRFASPDVVIEEGTARTPGSAGTSYTVVHVKRNGQWQMYDAIESAYSTSASISDLSWLVGDWLVKDKDRTLMQVSVKADSPKNFLQLTYRDTAGAVVNSETVGTDPSTGNLTSWTFNSSGGIGKAVWTKTESGWIKQAHSIESSGARGKATYRLSSIASDRFTWSSSDRYLSGRYMGKVRDLDVVRVVAEAVK